MCVDFTDLNETSLNDSFPFPQIDQIVDSTTNHKLFSFLDVFLRYNQIPLYVPDAKNMTFITSLIRVYNIMSFGSRNTRAIY